MTSTNAAPDAAIYLVRHAEKEAGPDPALDADGQARAERLVRQFHDVPLRAIYSTDYRRTRQTVEGIAADHGLTVRTYDGTDLGGLAQTLRQRGETALVVGHSNTTPEMVRALGGSYEPMTEAEYDRLYRVSLASGETERLTAGGDPL